jgi:hypothetical protein
MSHVAVVAGESIQSPRAESVRRVSNQPESRLRWRVSFR